MTELEKAIIEYTKSLPDLRKSAKDMSHLVQKKIINKDGKSQTVWVDPNKGKPVDINNTKQSTSKMQSNSRKQHILHGMAVGEVRRYGGKELMKIGKNRYAAVKKGRQGTYVTDNNEGYRFKRDIFGKIHAESFKVMHHEVTQADNSAKRPGSVFSQKELKEQKKNQPKDISELRPGHIVRIRHGEGITKEEEKAGGKIGRVQKIKNNIVYILDQAGNLIDIPMRTLEFAKSKKEGT